MSIYYKNRIQPLKALYDKIEAICLKHIAVASFDCGDLDKFDGDIMKFPAAYLETIVDIQENGRTETYSIALNLLDRKDTDATKEQVILTHDKLKQIFTEIKLYMEQKKVFGAGVGNASILLFNDFEDERLVRLRGDFSLTVEALVTPVAELVLIFPERG